MLERDVSIGGVKYGYHEISMLECVPNDHITVTVENFTGVDAKGDGEMPTDTYHELEWPSDGIVDANEIEERVWKLEAFSEHVEVTADSLKERDELIAKLGSMLTAKQMAALAKEMPTAEAMISKASGEMI